jgi:hypothetical protein
MSPRGLIALVLALAFAPAVIVGQTRWAPPHTAWGDPDLQGIWVGATNAPLERAAALGDREFFTDAELADKLAKAQARKELQAAGKVENRGFRVFPNYNAIFDYSEGPERISEDRRTSAIVDPPNGRLPPWTLAQVKQWEAREAATAGHGESDTIADLNLGYRCINVVDAPQVTNWGLSLGVGVPVGIGRSTIPADDVAENDGLGGNSGPGPVRQIIQTPGYVALVMGDDSNYRIVPLDGRPRLGRKIRQYMGDARGHWEGTTLVVEITNITFGSPVIPNFGGSLYPGTGETLRVIERFTPLDANTIEYRYTIDDPGVYTRPYTVLHRLKRNDDFKSVTTSICQEDPKNVANALANSRADEQTSLQAGEDSVAARQPRFEQLKKEAETHAKTSTNR